MSLPLDIIIDQAELAQEDEEIVADALLQGLRGLHMLAGRGFLGHG